MADSTPEPKILIDAATIARRIDALAAEVQAALPADFVMVVILNGAFMFAADLARALARRGSHPTMEFVNLKSYGDATESSGQVRVLGTLPERLDGRAVLIVDDILDTGRTLHFARALLAGLGANPVRICVFLDKPARRAAPMSADHVGFTIEDRFVVGYGLDHAKRWRGLPDLSAVD
ncbi:MAG: hypoxanthine phosphoribosyltransferase [Alphaproteobacteria bacterium]|nr:hypoxanthine phosphoribosyltransferase [Alphaproteobacteria bacterium]